MKPKASPTWDILTSIKVASGPSVVLYTYGGLIHVLIGWMGSCAICTGVMLYPVKLGPNCMAVGTSPSSY